MVLVDTSVWVSHLRETHAGLVDLLGDGEVACHPFIVGELACGNLKNSNDYPFASGRSADDSSGRA